MVPEKKIIDFQYLLSYLCIPSVLNVLSYLKFGNNKLESNIQKKSSVSDFKNILYGDKSSTTETSDTDVHVVEWGWWVDTMNVNTKKKRKRYTMPRIPEYS